MSFPQGSGVPASSLPNTFTLARTYNAAWFTGATKEAQITAAIAQAVNDGMNAVYVPGSMFPYDGSLVTFNSAIKMLREGGNFGYYDILAYGTLVSNAVAFNNALANLPTTGGIIDATGLVGAQTLTSKISISQSNVTILFGAATFTLSGVPWAQTPFGSQFFITGVNVWLISPGANTTFIQGTNVQSVPIAFISGATLGGVDGIEINGNKANVAVTPVDDTSCTGIQIISTIAGGATIDARITIRRCRIHDMSHYAITTYGEWSGGNEIQGNRIYNNGKNDGVGTGDGIYINKGSGYNRVHGNYCYSNQRSGIRCSTAGIVQNNNHIHDNWCYLNANDGIRCDEDTNLGSIAGVGQNNIQIRGNHCYSNTGVGIRISCASNVGLHYYPTIAHNHCYSNSSYGILLVSNADPNSIRRAILVENQSFSNTSDGIGVGLNSIDCLVASNMCIANGGAAITDNGTRTIVLGNKVNIVDNNINIASALALGDQQIQWNEGGVRTWNITHGTGGTSGSLVVSSGDGAGTVRFPPSGGLIVTGPVLTAGAAVAGSGTQLTLGGTQGTTIGAAGGAAALPATPLGYLIAFVGATQVKIPYYNP